MGKILSLFRRQPSSEEKLTKLENQIQELEGYTLSTRETQRKFAGRFLVASIGTYVIGFIVFYFYFFPPTWKDRLLYSTPLLLFLVLIILLKYCVSWYFDSKIDRNNRKLIKLRNEKKLVLQNVMDKETYKVALEILNTFGDKSMRIKASHDLDSSTVSLNSTTSTGQLRTPARNTPSNRMAATPSAPNRGTPVPIGFRTLPPYPSTTPSVIRPLGATPGNTQYTPIVQKTPFPVIDARKQNVVEKMMDFIISDGPSNRFAMICNKCYGHNGMALQEEFEYVAFKCAFCATFNPARKMRPIARVLSPARKQMTSNRDLGSSSSEDESKNVPFAIKPQEMGRTSELDSESEEEEDDEKVVRKNPSGEKEEEEDGQVVKAIPSGEKEEENNNQAKVNDNVAIETVTEPKDLEEKKKD